MIRIVHIVPEDGIGGVEVAARSQVGKGSKDCFFQLIFIACKSSNRGSLNPLAHWRAFVEARSARPDVIIFSLWKTVPVALLLKIFRPNLIYIFTLNNETTAHLLDQIFSNLGIWIADEVWADSRRSLDARVAGRGKIGRAISFVVDRPLPPPNHRRPDFHFVSWGRLTRQKGLDRSIKFVGRMAEQGLDPRFDIWGPDAGERLRLEQLVALLGLGDRVAFKGPIERERLREVAADASFFFQLSRFEGLAMACVEAMQLGLVPVTTSAGAMSDYVIPGETGILVDPARIDSAIDEIIDLIENPDRYHRLRNGAIQRWRDAPIYADDMFSACADVYARLRPAPSVR